MADKYDFREGNKRARGKKKKSRGRMISPFFPALLLVLCLGSFLTVKIIQKQKEKDIAAHSVYYCDSSFSTEGMESYTDIKYYTDGLLVYTDANKTKGLMSAEGDLLTKPIYTEFFVTRYEGWHNVVYTAIPMGETYPKTVVVDEQRVDVKQYEGEEQDSAFACWDSGTNAMIWHGNGQKDDAVTYGELFLSSGLYAVPNSTKSAYGYIDSSMNLVIPLSYELALDFDGGLGAAKKGGKWGYLNESGAEAIDFRFDSVSDFTVEGADYCFGFFQGLAPVMENGKMGIVDKEGKTVVDFDYAVILPGENGKFIAQKGNSWGVITLIGVPEYEEVGHTNPKSVSTAGRDTYVVSTSGDPLNLRADSNSGAEVLAKIPNGTRINVTQILDGWAYTFYNNQGGWVSASYIEKAEESDEDTTEETDGTANGTSAVSGTESR